MRGGAAWPSTTVSDSCPTAGGTYGTQPVSGERSVLSYTQYTVCILQWNIEEVQPKSDLPSQYKPPSV